MDAIGSYTKSESYYDTLGCAETSTSEQISTEFRRLAKQYHPDKNSTDASKYDSLRRAYEILKTSESRKRYDMWLNSGLHIPFQTWDTMCKNRHASLHWRGHKKELAIKYADDNTDMSSTPTSSKKTDTQNVNTVTSSNTNTSVPKAASNINNQLKRPCFFNSSCGRSKFRKYQI